MIPRVLLRNVQVGTSYYIGLTNLVWRPFWVILVLHLQHVGKFLIVSFWFFVGEQILLYPFNNDTFKLRTKSDACLILLWNDYQVLGKDIYQTIFKRITDGQCPQRFDWRLRRVFSKVMFCSFSNCQFTVDRNLQNQSSAIIFHMPNLHWENYSYPTYRWHWLE